MDATFTFSPELIESIAQRAAELLADRAVASSSPWLTAEQAAEYMAAPVSRVRKLTMTRELPHAKDGRRVLYHRDELDTYLRSGGAKSP